MEATDKGRFAAAITALAEAFRADISKATISAYWMALDDLPLATIEGAVRQAMRTCKFFPAASELRGLAGEVRGNDRALLAWQAFEKAVVRHGGYRSVNFDDPAINATVRNLGGWARCCELPADEFDKWLRKDFLAAYAAISAAGVSDEASRPLLGMHAQNAALVGHNGGHEGAVCIAEVCQVETGLPGLLGAPTQRPRIHNPNPIGGLLGEVGKMNKRKDKPA